MDHLTLSSNCRAVLALATAASAIALLVCTAAGASSRLSCAPRITAGRPPGVTLRADGLRADGVTCPSARAVVLDYLQVKLRQASERCAGRAETPPYPGCVVEGWRCRATTKVRLRHGRPSQPQTCTRRGRAIDFTESDTSAR